MEAVVVGAGVSGLTTAVQLMRSGWRVRVLADRLPQETTSAAAGASWSPYMANHPMAMRWSEFTKSEFERLAVHPEATGVRVINGIEAAPIPVEIPQWATKLTGFRECSAQELPPTYVKGWWGLVPVVDMPVYLRYLCALLQEGGVFIEPARLSNLDVGPFVVNCSGAGARELAADGEVIPVKGQLVVVRNPGIDTYFQDHLEGEELTYFLPHGDHVVLGGCARLGDTVPTHDQSDADAILNRCAAVEPRLKGAEIIAHRVGFRPQRSAVRFGAERRPGGGVVIHNYGHGGSGVTMSWGCAGSVVELIAQYA